MRVKPAQRLRMFRLKPDVVAEPPTTAGIISSLSRESSFVGRKIAIQLYLDNPNIELLNFVRAAGATPIPFSATSTALRPRTSRSSTPEHLRSPRGLIHFGPKKPAPKTTSAEIKIKNPSPSIGTAIPSTTILLALPLDASAHFFFDLL